MTDWKILIRQDLLMSRKDLQAGGIANALSDSHLTAQSVDVYLKPTSPSIDNGDDNSQYIYDTPIRFPQGFDSSNCDSSFVSCIVVFNLALAHHLAAISGDTAAAQQQIDPQTMLIRACHLYDVCFQISCSCKSLRQSILFRLAVANNLGVLYHHHYHRDLLNNNNDAAADNKWFEYVLTTLMVMTTQQQRFFPGKAILERHDAVLEGFFANVTRRLRIIGQPAAGAA